MPCISEGYDTTPVSLVSKINNEKNKIEAMLCMVLSALEKEGLYIDFKNSIFDYKKAGVSKTEFAAWWSNHKAVDNNRKQKEEAAKKKALAKLTAADKKILGIKD